MPHEACDALCVKIVINKIYISFVSILWEVCLFYR